ncbi:Hypothetical predicted protein [Olea europaea subsp. europaea]|uniref:Uncharacterized protein n=1 Tax=Olea europaea subsp. europaea TaxID=158383 RepID=A0A8S0SJB7_OLEEU|nr:Hypothetical predicted protein [Olea europaea subsp. europaea]
MLRVAVHLGIEKKSCFKDHGRSSLSAFPHRENLDWEERKGRDESERQSVESQQIVVARPLCHLQYPVSYLSRLQRILPAARWKLYFKAANAARPLRGLGQRHVPLGAMCRPSQTPHLTMSSARIGPRSEPWVQKEGQCPASDSRNNRIPLVRTSSESTVRRPGKAPEGAVPSPSPGRHAATRSRRGSSSSSPPTADGFGTGTPVPSPQSQSFSRSYGSILPTSLAYIVPLTRGCSPWRPDAVMSTTGRGRYSVLRIFKGRRGRTGHHETSESTVRRPGKAPEGAVPSPSPGRHAATRSRRGSSSSSPPTADGFGTGTPVPSPQSQSFSRSYGSILPTSLAYIVPLTRGCSPWRPDAVMSTTGRGRYSVLRIFKGRRGHTGHHETCGALPAAGPYLRLSRFQGGQAVKQKR